MHNFISYVNRRMYNGVGYIKCGFKWLSYSKPSYFYVKGLNRYNRLEYQKHRLVDKLENYDSNLTEHENMFNNKFDWIYDCGTIKMYYE